MGSLFFTSMHTLLYESTVNFPCYRQPLGNRKVERESQVVRDEWHHAFECSWGEKAGDVGERDVRFGLSVGRMDRDTRQVVQETRRRGVMIDGAKGERDAGGMPMYIPMDKAG